MRELLSGPEPDPAASDRAALVVRWVTAAQRGDRAAFEALARTHLRLAYTVALSVVRRPADAEDVAQDALVRALGALDTCREPARFVPWLVVIVRNQSLNWLAKRKFRDVPRQVQGEDGTAWEDRQAAPDTAPASSREGLLLALDTLTETQREVVLLHDLEGQTHHEIGLALGCSEGMSRQHLFAARRALRAFFQAGNPPGERPATEPRQVTQPRGPGALPAGKSTSAEPSVRGEGTR
jgi:RNA polymerase sigma factor (sigma-70 family)